MSPYKNRPNYLAYQKRYSKIKHAELRKNILAHYGSFCSCCAISTKEFLVIDHINGGGTRHRKSKSTPGIMRDIVKNGFPDCYRILCANCNMGREKNNGLCPHEGIALNDLT
ncbi:MAG TPA: hypothetical protein ENH95_02905 [Nitrosopumilus sp.]|nr:hypothetical protein [Nitrosopumilus sp.]